MRPASTAVLILSLCFLPSLTTSADPDEDLHPPLGVRVRPAVSAEPVIMDISMYGKLKPESFRLAASRALIQRSWRIEVSEDTRLRGTLEKKGLTYKVEIRIEPSKIIIGFVPDYHSDRPNWLRNLEENITRELQYMSLQP